MKKQILLLSLLALSFVSCETEDYREVYVGDYNASSTGNINMMYNGAIAGTVPLGWEGSATVEKGIGENEILIDGTEATISGTKLIFDTETVTENNSGFTLQMTIVRTGSISNTIITVKETYSGTWQGSGISGVLSGNSNTTFTKK